MKHTLLLPLVLALPVSALLHAGFPAAGEAPSATQIPVAPGQNFTGTTSTLDTSGVVSVGRRLFEPGAHSNWHRHEGGQLVFAEAGRGFYQERGKPVRWLNAGESGYIPAGTPHWHGAVPTDSFTQLVVTFAGATTWMEPVTDEEYGRLIKQRNDDGTTSASINDQTVLDFDVTPEGR
jgi:4-carboxymuconolactone decarboxylase